MLEILRKLVDTLGFELYTYDIETYPNVFTCCITRVSDQTKWAFEITDRRNDSTELMQMLNYILNTDGAMVGFNNIGFDYPVINLFYHNNGGYAFDLYQKAQAIIDSDDRFEHLVAPWEIVIPQIDLFKICHFDNMARSTSLKMLEFNMRSPNIEDLPYEPGVPLSEDQIDPLIKYNAHDDSETGKFLAKCVNKIEFRQELSEKYGMDLTNDNDTKIGEKYFIQKLDEIDPNMCYDYSNGKKVKRGTHRDRIALEDAVLPYVQFEQPEFNRILQYFNSQVITETKGVFNDLTAIVDGFAYDFGAGGIHGSVSSSTVCADDEYAIIDVDVASYYPNLAIANRFYPEHLGEAFCDIYEDVFNQRKQFPKSTHPNENAMLKLALNGVYGKSNSHYSPFYDPLYTMKITINGQLLLCMLAEQLIKIPNLSMIQINTDGLTFKIPRVHLQHMRLVCMWWEELTRLELEEAEYSRMFIRDVNNYIAEYTDGKLKRKGAYEYERDWHQNQSQLVVPKAAEAALVNGECIEAFVKGHTDIYDFMLRTKVPRACQLVMIGDDGIEVPKQNITRFYATIDGGSLVKISPVKRPYEPGWFKKSNGLTFGQYIAVREELSAATGLPIDSPDLPWDERINTKNKSRYAERRDQILKDVKVTECNDILTAYVPINYDYYIAEVRKLVDPLR